MLGLVELGFCQNVRFQKDLTKKENLWYSGEELYTGEVITLSQDQIETRYSVEKVFRLVCLPSTFWTTPSKNQTTKTLRKSDD